MRLQIYPSFQRGSTSSFGESSVNAMRFINSKATFLFGEHPANAMGFLHSPLLQTMTHMEIVVARGHDVPRRISTWQYASDNER